MGTSIRLFFQSRTIERAYSSNRDTQCRNCWGFGHVAPRCESKHPVCPLCSHNHTRVNHRCPNPTWPGSGSLKPVPNGCSSSPAGCFHCGEAHSALYGDCTKRPVPPPLTGVTPLRPRSFLRPRRTGGTLPPMAWSSRPPLLPPVPSNRRLKWRPCVLEDRPPYWPLRGPQQTRVASLPWSPLVIPQPLVLVRAWPANAVQPPT